MQIRHEQPADIAAVHAVNKAAFLSDREATLVDALRAQAEPIISLVAEDAGSIVGHICFSPVTLSAHADLKIVRLGVNDDGDAEWSIIEGPHPHTTVIETDADRKIRKRKGDTRPLCCRRPLSTGNALSISTGPSACSSFSTHRDADGERAKRDYRRGGGGGDGGGV